MKTYINSKNDYYKHLSSLCNQIGKKYLNGEEIDLSNKWVVKTKNGTKEIGFNTQILQKNKHFTSILLTQSFNGHRKPIYIQITNGGAGEDWFELPKVEYFIDNMLYKTTICGNKIDVETSQFI